MKFDLIIKDATKEELISLLGADVIASFSDIPSGNQILQNYSGFADTQPDPNPDTPLNLIGDLVDRPQSNELDKNGLPWDLRIHSDPAKINADGSWRAKRGVEKELGKEGIAAIELELRNSLQSSPTQTTPPTAQQETPPPVTQQQTPPIPQTTADGNQVSGNSETMPDIPAFMDRNNQQTSPATQQQTPPMPETTAPTAQQETPPATTGEVDFHTFMSNLSSKMVAKDENGVSLASPEYLAGITAEISTAFNQQLSAITDVSKDQNMINFAVQLLQRDNRW